MSLIALELPYAVALDYQPYALIGAGGPTPGREHVFECLLSDLEWQAVQVMLDAKKVPFKVQLPGSDQRKPFNNPT
ncbi:MULTISPECIES: hypothetical protein [unclassified Duganella]|uniref:hypothetical protein n=1 Tax=unclassified Duganella TaxID=2636909 RepID=UPI00088D6649|nr:MULTISPECIES: hypothetical protein [unclassified Duganella]SDG77231.1 hypothetical protein SAMN05216320_10713 [Duganella sp. OV458]SDK04186.1 hypothetical protein SAMN05428973_10813 [Duganella sp. OV510]